MVNGISWTESRPDHVWGGPNPLWHRVGAASVGWALHRILLTATQPAFGIVQCIDKLWRVTFAQSDVPPPPWSMLLWKSALSARRFQLRVISPIPGQGLTSNRERSGRSYRSDIMSMPKRIQAILDSKGNRTKYYYCVTLNSVMRVTKRDSRPIRTNSASCVAFWLTVSTTVL